MSSCKHIQFLTRHNQQLHIQTCKFITNQRSLPEDCPSWWPKHVRGYAYYNILNLHICTCPYWLILIRKHQCMVTNHLKLINAQKAKIVHTYENKKEKLHRTNAAIWFNKVCRLNNLTPSYIKITKNSHIKQC